MYSLPKTLFYYYTSYWTVPLGTSIYILDNRITKGSLVRRGYISSRGEDYKGESNSE
jgi:hypothetical protein